MGRMGIGGGPEVEHQVPPMLIMPSGITCGLRRSAFIGTHEGVEDVAHGE
jgi:hypothetical protein